MMCVLPVADAELTSRSSRNLALVCFIVPCVSSSLLTGTDLQHHMSLVTLENKLCLSPLHDNIKRVLDVGTGSGIWAIEFGSFQSSVDFCNRSLTKYSSRRASLCKHSWKRPVTNSYQRVLHYFYPFMTDSLRFVIVLLPMSPSKLTTSRPNGATERIISTLYMHEC